MAKICLNCGSPLEDDAKFCSKCGSAYNAEPVCVKCGCKLTPGARFCPNCGADQSATPAGSGGDYIKKGLDTFTATINTMAGESGKAEIHLKELYSDVFKSHTQEERDVLFACGTSKTTPKESEMIAEWPRPWLYSRIFLMFMIVFVGLYIMVMNFNNLNAVPGSMFVGALLVPLTVMIFFWEMNVPRNISILDVLSVFFVGGVFSLVVTLFLYSFFPSAGAGPLWGSTLVGLVEELGKILVVAYYVKRNNIKYKLNGLLLGSCVGAGFAVFETAGYAFQTFLRSGDLTYAYFIPARRVSYWLSCRMGGHFRIWTDCCKGRSAAANQSFLLRKIPEILHTGGCTARRMGLEYTVYYNPNANIPEMCGTDPDRPWHSAGIAERRPAAGIRNRSKGAGRGTGGRQQTVKRTEGNCTARRVKRV